MGVRSGTGDKGYTQLAFKEKIRKDSPDIRAIGDLDELISYLGLVKVKIRGKRYKTIIEIIQTIVSTSATEIAVGKERKKDLGDLLSQKDTDWSRKTLYELESRSKIEGCFHLPGISEVSALLDVCRAIARRAERSVVALFHGDKMKNNNMLLFLNCVSDILFIMARQQADKVKSKKNKS